MKTDIYTLAHEVKNPLSVVKGYLEMMNKENFERYKRIINEEIDSSLEILNNYLEFNKISINKEEMDLNILLMDIKNNMKEYLENKGVKLQIITIDDDIYLEADYQKLRQVFYNIIKNSVEAHAKKIVISYKIIYGKVMITIMNDGDKIIDINKVGNNYTTKILGNGIGTTLSKKIINMHDGKIKYLNNEDKGVSTIITLNLS